MADDLILRAEPRTILGKKVKRLRREGRIPGIVYGPVVQETVPVSVDGRDFAKFYQAAGHSTIFSLQWQGGDQTVLIREVQVDPVRQTPVHIDFFAPNLRQKLRATVPVVLHNSNPDAAGILNTVRTEIEVEGLPRNLPHQIDGDLSGLLEIGDVLRVADLPMPESVEAITDAEEVIANLVAQAVEPEPEEEVAEEEAAEAEAAEDGETPEAEGDTESADEERSQG